MPAGPPPLQDPSSAVEVTVGQEHFRNGEVTLVVEDARLDRLLQRWQELTEEITDGALPYGDPS